MQSQRTSTIRVPLTGCGCSCGMMILIWVIASLISGLCWQYSVNHWLVYAHKPPNVHLWQAMLLGFVPGLGEIAIPVAALTFFISLFM